MLARQLLLDISFAVLQGNSDSRDDLKMFSSYAERGLATVDPEREFPVPGPGWTNREALEPETLKTEMMEGESVLDQKISPAEGLGLHDNPLLSSKQR